MGGVERVGASITSAVISTRPLFAALIASDGLDEPITGSVAAGIAVLVVILSGKALSRDGYVDGWDREELLSGLPAAGRVAVENVVGRDGLQLAGATVTVSLPS